MGKRAIILVIMVSIASLIATSVGCSKSATTTIKPVATTTTAKTTTASSTTSSSTAASTTTAATTTTAKPTPSPTPVEPIKIGLIEDLSGPIAFYGSAFMAGEKVAVQMINDAGGIKSLGGAKLVYAQGAGDSTVPTSTAEIERLVVSEKVVAIMGPTSTAEVLASVPLFERYKIPAVTVLNDTTQFQKGYRYLFSIQVYGTQVGNSEAEMIDSLVKTYGAPTDRIGIATLTPTYVEASDTAVARLAELGYKNIVVKDSFPSTVTDHSPLVLKFKSANVNFVIYNGPAANGIAFFKACNAYDYYPWMVAVATGMDASVRDALGPDAKKLLARPNLFGIGSDIYSEAYLTVPSLKAFQDAFKKLYPDSKLNPTAVAHGAQKVFVLARAIEMAASRNPEDIANAMRKVDIKAPDPYIVWSDNYPRLTMADNGIVSPGLVTGVQWADDMKELQAVWPPSIATAKFRVQK